MLNDNILLKILHFDIGFQNTDSQTNLFNASAPTGYIFYNKKGIIEVAKISVNLVAILEKCSGKNTVNQLSRNYFSQSRNPEKKKVTQLKSFIINCVRLGVLSG